MSSSDLFFDSRDQDRDRDLYGFLCIFPLKFKNFATYYYYYIRIYFYVTSQRPPAARKRAL